MRPALWLGLLFCAGCVVAQARERNSPADDRFASDTSIGGTWKGVYYVYPNLMTLELDLEASSGGNVSGVLKYAPKANPQQRNAFGAPPSGSYKVSGRFDEPTRTFVLTPGAWIERPAMPGQTAPLVGIFDAKGKVLAGVFQFRSAITPVTFVVAAGSSGDQLIADITRSANPAPLTAAQANGLRARQQQQQLAAISNPQMQQALQQAQARQRQQLINQIEQLDRSAQRGSRYGGNEAAIQVARERLQERLDALPGGTNSESKEGTWTPPSVDQMIDWLSPLKKELAALHLENAAMERIYVPAYNLFDDDYFKAHFCLTFEAMDTMQRKAVATVITQHSQELYGIFMGRPFQNVGQFGAPDVTVAIYWQRAVRAWLGEVPSAFADLPADTDAFSHLAAAESATKDLMPLLWSNEREKFHAALAEAREQLSGPALSRKVDQLIASSTGVAGARALSNWSATEKDLLRNVLAADREKLQQRVDARIDEIIDELMANERQQLEGLGSGMQAVERGAAWYTRFTRDYQPFLHRPVCEEVLNAYRQRRPGDLAGVADQMIAVIRGGYDQLSWDDTAEAERGRVQFASDLAGHLGAWFAVPGDDATETARKVYAVASELGGKVGDLLPPSKRARLHFASDGQSRSGRPAGSARERSPVSIELLAVAGRPDDSGLSDLLPVPIADAGFEFGTDICWAIFHGRFDDIRNASAAQSGLGSKLSVAVRNTNPQFHYAFISFVGVSSERCGEKQIGDFTTMFWKTTTVYPDGTSVVDDSEKYPVKIPVVFTQYYEDSYNIAQGAADGDGLFGSNPLGYLQTAAKLMKNGWLSQAGTRADGSFSIAQADWERPILADINALFTAWPPQSFGIWQFQENLRRYLNGQKSLQELWAQTRQENGWGELMTAARRDDTVAIAQLLSHGARVNAKDRFGRTALHLAAQDGAVEAMDALLRAGADVNARTNIGATPLSFAVTYDDTVAVKRLLTAKASVDLAKDDGLTPLLEAAHFGYVRSTELLLDAGASPTRVDKAGMNMLDHAVTDNSAEILHVLLSRPGINLRARNKDGWNALHIAAKANAAKAIGELVAKGLEVNGKTAEGYTPLHIAALNGSIGAINALLLRGADTQARDAAGKTPLDEAIAQNNEAVMLALRGQGQGSH